MCINYTTTTTTITKLPPKTCVCVLGGECSLLCGSEWYIISCFIYFTSGEREPGVLWIGGWFLTDVWGRVCKCVNRGSSLFYDVMHCKLVV